MRAKTNKSKRKFNPNKSQESIPHGSDIGQRSMSPSPDKNVALKDETKQPADSPTVKSQIKPTEASAIKKEPQIVLPHGIDPETERMQKQKVSELQAKQVTILTYIESRSVGSID